MSAQLITIFFLFFAIIMFAWEKIPLSITAMILSVGLIVTGVLTPAQAFAGFVDSNVLLFMGMFIVGAGFFETGMAQKVGGLVTMFAKTERMLILAIMVIAGLMSGVLSNTGTAAVLIPVIVGISAKSGYSRSRLLLPLIAACALGGNLSLIGAPGNMIAQSALKNIGMEYGFFEYAKVGLPVLVLGILYFVTIGYKFLPNKKDDVQDADDVYSKEVDYSAVPKWKKIASLVILLATIIGMIFEKQIGIKLFVTSWIGALALVVLGVISEKDAMKSIDMKTIFLFVGSLSLAKALEVTKAGDMIADTLISGLGADPSPLMLTAVVFLVAVLLTNFMSNTATTALLVPVSLSIAQTMGADPKAVLMATVIGGSLAIATPIGMPANTMIYGIGGYKFMDYVKVGVPAIVVSVILALILLPIIFPFYP